MNNILPTCLLLSACSAVFYPSQFSNFVFQLENENCEKKSGKRKTFAITKQALNEHREETNNNRIELNFEDKMFSILTYSVAYPRRSASGIIPIKLKKKTHAYSIRENHK